MKQIFTMLLVVLLVVIGGGSAQGKKIKLNTTKDKVSYGIGVRLGQDFSRQGFDVDLDIVLKGIKDTMAGGQLLMTEAELQKAMSEFQQELMAKRQTEAKAMAKKNAKEGKAFLAKNAKKKGVVTLASGLQYKIITKGKGKKPKAQDTVTVNYRGTLINGQEFDSSFKHGKAATFPVSAVIPGWTEALQLMKPGAKWELYIPASLAYGERGSGPKIGPDSTLIFEVELLSIQKNTNKGSGAKFKIIE